MTKKLRNLAAICFLSIFVMGIAVMDRSAMETAYAAGSGGRSFAPTANLDSDYGYKDLEKRSNGTARQELYIMLENAAEEFAGSNADLSSNVICELDVTALGLSWEEIVQTYFVMCYDNPQYYWMSNEISMNESAGSISIPFSTFEEYRSYSARSRYDSSSYGKSAGV